VSRTERAKGARGERELIHLLREHGWPDAKRTSDGQRQSGRGDITNGPAGVHLESKRQETTSIWAWTAQAEADAPDGCIPIVAFRRSRSPWMACLPLDELLHLLAHRERA
jgi:Holliday junction resolvase